MAASRGRHRAVPCRVTRVSRRSAPPTNITCAPCCACESGEEIVVTDGAGAWSLCEVGDHALHRVTPVHVDPPSPQTTLYLSPLKGRPQRVDVVKATELGVHRIVPLMSARVGRQVPR